MSTVQAEGRVTYPAKQGGELGGRVMSAGRCNNVQGGHKVRVMTDVMRGVDVTSQAGEGSKETECS